jgi:metal-dependent amidase/aminoacylase/carboxypeptidase family protein
MNMKPCARNRKLLVWLSLRELDHEPAAAIREHVKTCAGCRQYLAELSGSIETLRAAAPAEADEASARFHQRVARAVRAIDPQSPGRRMAEYLRAALLDWRVAVPLAGAIVTALVIWAPRGGHPPGDAPPDTVRHEAPGPVPKRDAILTAASYWMETEMSFEELDERLTREGNRPPPPGPIYTPMMATLAEIPE